MSDAGAVLYTVTIPGKLRGKQRPRMTKRGHAFTPAETVNAEAWVRQCAVDQVGSPVMDFPLALSLSIASEVPDSWSKKKRAAALGGSIKPAGKPDLDNMIKLVGDALNGILWRDDALIVKVTASKFYATRAFATVTVSPA